jgi:hypothetical protein
LIYSFNEKAKISPPNLGGVLKSIVNQLFIIDIFKNGFWGGG